MEKKTIFIFFAILLTMVIIMSGQVRAPTGSSYLANAIFSVLSPLSRGAHSAVSHVKDWWEAYIDLRGAHKEKEMLEERVRGLEAEYIDIEELRSNNKRLRALLDLREATPYPSLPAEVIGNDSSSYFKSIIINKGTSHSLRPDMPVTAPGGLVGRVIRTSTWASQVQLMTDINSGVAAMVQRSRAQGVVVGEGANICSMKYVTNLEDVAPDDLVVTSGMEGIYPKGIPIGRVVMVKKSATLFQQIRVIPAVDLRKLEEVLIILKERESLTFKRRQ